MHHVNSGLIRPYTEGPDSSHGICGLSYALKENSKTAGLRCDLFISHAWDEGGPSPKRFDKGISWPVMFFLLQHQTGQMPCFHGKFPARCLRFGRELDEVMAPKLQHGILLLLIQPAEPTSTYQTPSSYLGGVSILSSLEGRAEANATVVQPQYTYPQ